MDNIAKDEIYEIDIIIDKTHMNREAFYNILKLLNVTDRKTEFKVLNYFINTDSQKLTALADEIKAVKGRR